jgi:hypothetical protein
METIRKAYRINWALLSEWYHVEKDVTEDEILDMIMDDFQAEATREQVKQRLFGGFFCAEDPNGVHIMHYTGGYTYLGRNDAYSPEDRLRIWKKALSANLEPMIEGSLFMEDYPGGTDGLLDQDAD